MTADNRLLVAGASGIVGRAVLAEVEEAIGVSRRRPDLATPLDFRALDLFDAAACAAAAPEFADVTHVVFAALHERPGLVRGWRDDEQMQANLAMLVNLMDPLERQARNLRHVTLLQGTKAYGVHLGRLKSPGRERNSRDAHANFYWLQEDWLRQRQRGKGWRFTILRPQVVIGHALGAPMNLLAAIGAYAALLKARGEPLHWPGGPGYALEATCAHLLARAIVWAGQSPAAANQTFNVTNGDVLLWPNIWPAIARALGMQPGEARPLKLAEDMPGREPQWASLVERHGLKPLSLRALAGDSFIYADFNFASGLREAPPPALASTVKIRQAGFADCIDSEDMFAAWFEELRRSRILPPL